MHRICRMSFMKSCVNRNKGKYTKDEIDRIFEKNRKPTYTKPVILTEYDGRKESE